MAFVFHQEEAASKLDCRKLKYQISELHNELLDLKIQMGMPLMGDKPSVPSSPKTPKVGLSPLSHRKFVSSRASFSKTGGVTGTKVASVLPMPDFKFKKDKDGKPLRMVNQIKELSSMNRAVKLMSIAAGPSRTSSDAEAFAEKPDDAQVPHGQESAGGEAEAGGLPDVAGGEAGDGRRNDPPGEIGGPKGRGPHKIVPSRLKVKDKK